MRKQSVAIVAAFILLGPPWCQSAQLPWGTSAQADHALAFISSWDADSVGDREEVRKVLHLLAANLKIPEESLPHIIVIHVSRDIIHAAHLHKGSVYTRRDVLSDQPYYELWLAEKVGPPEYVAGMYSILALHFDLPPVTPARRKEIVVRVLRELQATVSAHSLSK